MKLFRRKVRSDRSMDTVDFELTGHLDRDVKNLEKLLSSHDLTFRRISGKTELAVGFFSSLCNNDTLERDVIAPLNRAAGERALTKEDLYRHIHTGDVRQIKDEVELLELLLDGFAVILMDGRRGALAACVEDMKRRDISKPITEVVIRGSHEAFNESIIDSIGLIRRRLATERFRIEMVKVGKVAKSRIAFCYLDGIARPELVEEVRRRVQRIEKFIFDSGNLEQLIADHPWTPFPQLYYTERPDKAVASLLEGRVILLTDGSPYALIAPTTLFDLLHPSEDYYFHFLPASAIRIVRYISAFFALFLPSIYVVIVMYRPELIPTELFFRLIAQREGVPLPTVLEIFLMEVSFELMREAGIRLPPPAGQAVSIVGALIVGEAMIDAGLVAPVTVIVTATTGLSSFTISAFHLSYGLRVLRFLILLFAAFIGIFGLIIATFLILLHLLSLKSFGFPYLSPVVPGRSGDWRDVFIRFPMPFVQRQPVFLKNKPLLGRRRRR
ncbi:MAG: spore germination protein [Planifilum fulgidum]